MWKEVQQTRKKEVLSSHFVESSRPSLTTVRLEVHYPKSKLNRYQTTVGSKGSDEIEVRRDDGQQPRVWCGPELKSL